MVTDKHNAGSEDISSGKVLDKLADILGDYTARESEFREEMLKNFAKLASDNELNKQAQEHFVETLKEVVISLKTHLQDRNLHTCVITGNEVCTLKDRVQKIENTICSMTGKANGGNEKSESYYRLWGLLIGVGGFIVGIVFNLFKL